MTRRPASSARSAAPEVAPPRPSLRERNKARTKVDLVEAALAVFGAQGYAGTTVDAICAQAGIARGTLYAHFPDGRDAVLREAYAAIGEEVLALALQLREKESSHPGRMLAMVQALLQVSADPLKGPFYDAAEAMVGPVIAPVLGRSSKAFADWFRADLLAARKAGMLKAGADEELLAQLLVGASRAAARRVVQRPSTLRQVLKAFALLVDGLLL